MFNPNLQKGERYTLEDKWVGMTNHSGNAHRVEVLGARSDASLGQKASDLWHTFPDSIQFWKVPDLEHRARPFYALQGHG